MEQRSFTTAGGGSALTTTALLIPVATAGKISGTGEIALTGRNFSTAVVVKYLLNPRLTLLITDDGNATFTDESDDAQDGSASTDVTLSSLPATPLGYVYLGTTEPVRGYRADVDAANGTAGTMTGDYWNGSAWASLSITDGTASGGAPWAQDGDITFTVPSAWTKERLGTILGKTQAELGPPLSQTKAQQYALFWTRLSNTGACDSSTTLNSLMPLNRSTAYAELVSGYAALAPAATDQSYGYSAVEALTDAGTANLVGVLAGNFVV